MAAPVETGSDPKVDRTQVVQRVATLLRLLAQGGTDGVRLLDLARESGVARPSVHRILQDLIVVGYVEQRRDRRYALGPAVFDLALTAPNPVLDPQGMRDIARALARDTGDTVYVGIRRFDGIHYLLREEGQFPIRTHIVQAGDVKSFTSSYSGIALLAHADPQLQERALAQLHLDPRLESVAVDLAGQRRSVRTAMYDVLTRGYLFGANLVMPGVAGMAAPVPSRALAPYLSLSISAIEQRMPPQRVPELAELLLAAVARMSEVIR